MEIKVKSIEDFLKDEKFVNWVLNKENDTYWLEYQKQYSNNQQVFNNAKDFILAGKMVNYPSLTSVNKEVIWSKIESATIKNKKDQKVKLVSNRNWLKYAAAVIFIIGVSWIYIFQSSKNNSVLSTPKIVAKSIKTDYQQRQQMTLPDGSIVTLNANSTLKVSNNWDTDHTREVWLDGEAFFEVLKKPNTGAAKFIVHTSQLNIEVLGTAFNVKSRRGSTEVVLQSGKVKLNKVNSPSFKVIEMIPGDKVKISNDVLAKIELAKVETEKITSWTNGKIIFENAPLTDVAKSIEDHYGYKVFIKNEELKSLNYTGELLTDMPDIFFSILSKTMNLKVNVTGKNIEISKN
jgi:transmembrane sensor